MKINLGMSEILLVGSVYIYQQAFVFSMVLFTLALLGKVFALGLEIQKTKEKSDTSKELTKNIVDTIINAVTLTGITNTQGKNGYH